MVFVDVDLSTVCFCMQFRYTLIVSTPDALCSQVLVLERDREPAALPE